VITDMATKDRVVSLVLLLFCAFFYYQSFSIKSSNLTGLDAAFFPRLLIGLIALLAVLILVRSFLPARKKVLEAVARMSEQEEKQSEDKNRGWLVWFIFALFGLYIFSLGFLGFILASFLFMTIVYLLIIQGNQHSAKNKAVAISSLLATSFILAFIFEKLLNVFLPRGIFF
jgi:putative tricarboxylic transport membrane protein